MKTPQANSSKFHRTNTAERTQWLERLRESGLTQREFAEQHGMGLSTLNRWLRQQKRPVVTSPRVEEVPLQALLGGAPSWVAEVVFKNGTTLRLASEVATTLLQRWLGHRPG